MLKIDDQSYSQEAIAEALANVSRWLDAQAFPVTRLAVCTANVLDWLLLVLHCRARGLALAPIHAETPLVTVREKALKMGCDALWWLDQDGLQELPHDAARRRGVLIQMSSGTTGEPKMVERTWAEIEREIAAYNQRLELDKAVTPIVACSVTHSYGLICGVLATLARSGEPHIVTSWNPKYLLRVLASYPRPLLYSAPSLIYSLVQLLPDDQRIHSVMTSGTSLPTNWFNQIKSKVGLLLQQYGCSEAGCVCIARNPSSADVIGTPLSHLQMVLEADSMLSGPSLTGEQRATSGEQWATTGELLVQLPEKIVRTQDLVQRSATGNWLFRGRMDDTIIVSGINVFPAEVEEILSRMPGMQEVVVFKRSDELVGQRVAAVYVAERLITPQEMRSWCALYMPRHQWPSHWWRVPAIPKLANGKISRRLLAERNWQMTEVVG